MSDHAERQVAAEAELAAIKDEAQAADDAASEERTAAAGWPIRLEDGSTVMVVRKEASAAGVILVAEDGTEYTTTRNGHAHVAVGRAQTEAETADVEETGEAA